jgi:hypothetical protein
VVVIKVQGNLEALHQQRIMRRVPEERPPVLWASIQVMEPMPNVGKYSINVQDGVGLFLRHSSTVPARAELAAKKRLGEGSESMDPVRIQKVT